MEAPPRTGRPKDGRTLDAGGCRPSAVAEISRGCGDVTEVVLCTTCFCKLAGRGWPITRAGDNSQKGTCENCNRRTYVRKYRYSGPSGVIYGKDGTEEGGNT